MRIAWPDRTRRPSAGRVLAVVSILPALIVAGWLLAALPLLLAGWYQPVPALVLGVVVIALLCRFVVREPLKVVEATGRQVGAVVAVAVGSGVFNAITHTEQLIVRRDPATYAQYAIWLARHGSLPIIPQVEAFGGPDPALRFDSIGFYPADGAVVPQFMPGPPLLFAAGDWLGGLGAMLLTPAVLGALAVLTLAGVVGRLVGGRWAAVAALAFAVSLPILYTSRTTFSEIPSLVLLFGGLALVHDALSREDRSRGWAAALGGLVFGLAVLVRIDGLRDVLPVLAFAGALIAWRRLGRPQGALGLPLLAGLATGAGLGLLAAYVLARPYLSYLSKSVNPLLAICAAVLLLTLAGALTAPRLARIRLPRRLPDVGAGLVVLVVAGLAVRPWLQTVTRVATTREDRLTAEFIRQTQKNNGLPVDGTRLYSELSLHWVSWYVGIPVIVLATLAAAVLVRRLLRNGSPAEWLLPLAVIGWTTVTTLLRPEITPDHPWAARRLVPVVIPGMILLAVWGLEWVRTRAPMRGYGRWIGVVGAALILVPPAITSIGTAFTPVERGERAAVEAMCAKIPPNASVLIIERVTANRFTQVVRGMCDRPTAQVLVEAGKNTAKEEDVRRLIDRVRAVGRVPVLLAAEAVQVAPYGPNAQVMALVSRQDERSLIDAPNGTWGFGISVWMAVA
ncbi:glycosyltransferase family 39 protein [Nonomuraea sp. NPDC052129]|uniref:glycosyltransferase family 39 protein n=1 Tax=Nonomuraea sp. NPDC052129 TaxID=3154651 RepID=UPI00342DC802